MKKLSLLFTGVFFSISVLAQAPEDVTIESGSNVGRLSGFHYRDLRNPSSSDGISKDDKTIDYLENRAKCTDPSKTKTMPLVTTEQELLVSDGLYYGGFEAGIDVPDGWELMGLGEEFSDDPEAAPIVDDIDPYTGSYSLKFRGAGTMGAPDGKLSVAMQDLEDVEQNESYTLRFRVRGDGKNLLCVVEYEDEEDDIYYWNFNTEEWDPEGEEVNPFNPDYHYEATGATEWDEHSFEFTSPSEEWDQFTIIFAATESDIWLDDVRMRKDDTGDNLIANGDFSSLITFPIGWSFLDRDDGEVELEDDPDHVYEGDYAVRLKKTGPTTDADPLWSNLDIEIIASFDFSFVAKIDDEDVSDPISIEVKDAEKTEGMFEGEQVEGRYKWNFNEGEWQFFKRGHGTGANPILTEVYQSFTYENIPPPPISGKLILRFWLHGEEEDHPYYIWVDNVSIFSEVDVAVAPAEGNGEPGSPYEIATWQNLYWISQNPDEWDKHYIQTADIDFGDAEPAIESWDDEKGFPPIGTHDEEDPGQEFNGNYNGQGHFVANLFIERMESGFVGLFGAVGPDGVISNLGVTDAQVSGYAMVGALAGGNFGLINSCFSSGNVSGVEMIGGLVGGNIATTQYSWSSAVVQGGEILGGLAGGNLGYIEENGEVIIDGDGTILTSYASGNVSHSEDYPTEFPGFEVGGLVGFNHGGVIHNAYSSGEVSGIDAVGGLAGANYGIGDIEHTYSTGLVSGDTNTGGLIGNGDGSTSHSFWDTETSEQLTSAGGTGKSTADMKTQSTFTVAGWDFDGIWDMHETKNDGYPFLKWQFPFIWTGTTDTDWNTDTNWDYHIAGIPTLYDYVTIPDVTNKPEITTGTNAKAKSIVIESGASLTITENGQLTVDGDLTNAAGVGGLIIQSSPGGTGSLIHNTPGVKATVQYYMPASEGEWPDKDDPATDWYYLSAPVIYQDIEAFLQGYTGQYDLYRWDEATNYWLNYKAGDGPPGNNFSHTSFETGTGYITAFEDERTHEFNGNLFVSNIEWEDLSYTPASYANDNDAGWHLVGNPYASGIVFDESWWNETNVEYTPQYWDGVAYQAYQEMDVIPQASAFFVRVTDETNSLDIPAATRQHDNGSSSKSNSYIILAAKPKKSALIQRSYIRLASDAGEGFDNRYHSRFRAGYAPVFYSKLDEHKLLVNAVQELHENLSIPFVFEKLENTCEYIIRLEKSIDGATPYLIDLIEDVEHELEIDKPYHFYSSPEDYPGRFKLRFNPMDDEDPTGIKKTEGTGVQTWYCDNTLYVNSHDESTTLQLFDISGRKLQQFHPGSGEQSYQLNLTAGVYVVRTTTENTSQSMRIVVNQ